MGSMARSPIRNPMVIRRTVEARTYHVTISCDYLARIFARAISLGAELLQRVLSRDFLLKFKPVIYQVSVRASIHADKDMNPVLSAVSCFI